MSTPHRLRGVKILKAVSSPVRLQILNLLFDTGPLSYTELMNSLKMNPSRDAGRFAYHLKFLLKADLIEADVESKKYCLTDLGKTVIDVADKIERKAFKQKRMLVRTSQFTLEEFDMNKITSSLIREAKTPAELAQRIAKEAEKRLLKSKTKYLTAPLVREVVNAILIEKGFEEYRHKLTRLGLPVYDLTAFVESRSRVSQSSASIHEAAAEIALKEYVLLNVLPRDIADAHLSGAIHLSNLDAWILKPNEIMHDIRFFFQNGLDLEGIDAYKPLYPPPKNLVSALNMILNVLLHSSKEVSETQTIDYFNIFLAPFVKSLDSRQIKETLRRFVIDVNQHLNASIGLELTVPDFLAEKNAVEPFENQMGRYGDFFEEAQLLASLLLEALTEESTLKPLMNPQVIVKIRSETFADQKAEALLEKAHSLALMNGSPYFVNLLKNGHKHDAFSASGFRLETGQNGDWEIDTLRNGCLGQAAVNMPRIAYESGKDEARFLQSLKERMEMAARSLGIKQRRLKQYSKSLLPFLTQTLDGDHYFRLERSANVVNLVGFKEALETLYGKEEKAAKLVDEILYSAKSVVSKLARKYGKILTPTLLPNREASKRLVLLDIEKYGIARVRFSGTREEPFYSTANRLSLKKGKTPLELATNQHELPTGESLTVIELEESTYEPKELLSLTKEIFTKCGVKFFTYNRRIIYCANCRKSLLGTSQKCPSCGATSTLILFDRFALQ